MILVLDDEQLVLAHIASSLRDGGFPVRPVSCSQDAMAIIEAHRGRDLGALVTDINMPAPDGWSVALRVRELNPDLPVIYVSGAGFQDWPSKGVPNSRMLQKPFAPAELVAAVSQLVDAQQSASDRQGGRA